MKTNDLEVFVRSLKHKIDNNEEARFAFFIGAGCSISSGIHGAKTLVTNWLPDLQLIKTGNRDNTEKWAKSEYNDLYDPENPAKLYAAIFKELFETPADRRAIVEGFSGGKDPGFGYAVLAQLMGHVEYSRNFNTILTTNFDDLVADALYLFTRTKPLVINHESLVDFVRITSAKPLVLKIHGDAMFEPKGTPKQTEKLSKRLSGKLRDILCEAGVIFIGYGGNDNSVERLFSSLPVRALPHGIYWVNEKIPDTEFGNWLKKKDAVHVTHTDFDELMLIVRDIFGLPHPDEKRFKNLMVNYANKFKELDEKISKTTKTGDTKVALEQAVEKARKEFKSWMFVEIEASRYRKVNPDKAQEIYEKGLKEFPESTELLNNYAIFLEEIQKDYDRAEECYRRSLEADPNDAIYLGNYAIFLHESRKDYDRAEEYYRRSLEADPNHANNLGNHANFLYKIRKDYDRAEEYYRRSLEADPNNAHNLGNYAYFLYKIRKNHDQAEKYYRRSIEADPNYNNSPCNYAGFLLSRGNRKVGFNFLEKAMSLADRDDLIIECWFYKYAHENDEEVRGECLKKIKLLIEEGKRSPAWDLSNNVERAIADGHPAPELLAKLAKVIANEADVKELDRFEEWKKA